MLKDYSDVELTKMTGAMKTLQEQLDTEKGLRADLKGELEDLKSDKENLTNQL